MSEAVVSRTAAGSEPSESVFSTPALIVDLDAFDANVAAMTALLEGTGTTVRPHVKTHRTPALARRQLAGPAAGLTCATVGELEAFAAAGFDDLLLANEVVDPAKLERVAAVAGEARVTVAVDAPEPARNLSQAAVRAGAMVGVLIDVDVLIHRCGVGSVSEALELAATIERLPATELRGVMGFEGRLRPQVQARRERIAAAYDVLRGVARALRATGTPIGIVSAGGTSTLREAIADPDIIEVQAGVYCLMEPELLPLGLPFRCAAAVRAAVISRHHGRVVLDAGRRVMGMEYGPPVLTGIDGHVVAVSDEHTTVEVPDAPPIGATVDLVPGQIRTTFNLHDQVWLSRGGEVLEAVPVSARGRSG